MKNIIYMLSCMTLLQIFPLQPVYGQSIFNDTILFKINEIRQQGPRFKYLIEFESKESSDGIDLDGIGVLSMCGCYCDSIWDAWPIEIAPGGQGTATLYYSSGSVSPADPSIPSANTRQRGRVGIWQMPGSFLRDTEFILPITFKLNEP